MRKVHSQFTKGHSKFEVSQKKRVSPCVPNQALTVRDIVIRYVKKQPMPELDSGVKPVYMDQDMTHDSPDMNKLRDMDKMEKADFARNFKFHAKKAKKPEYRMTREEYDHYKQARYTAKEWDAIPTTKTAGTAEA